MLKLLLEFLAALMFAIAGGTFIALNAPAGVSRGINAFGTLLQRGDGVPITEGFTTLAELTNIEIPGVESDIYDLTHHTSPSGYKEYVLGLRDGGEVTLEGNYFPRDATQNATTGLIADNLSGVKRNFKCLFSDAVAATQAAYNAVMTNTPNANLKFVAVATGTGGNAITVAFVVAGANTPLTIGVVANAITVNVATTAGSAASSTAAQVMAAVIASGPASALVTPSLGANGDGTGIVNAIGATNLAGGAAAIAATVWSFAAYVRNFVARAPHDGKLSFRATLKITGAPVLA